MQRLYTQILLIAFLAIMTITPIRTMAEDAISSEVVLKVANTSGAANENVTFAFNLALLDALPQHEFSTTTIWTEDLNTFSGVLLKDLIELTGFQGESVTAWAINDYMAEFTVGSLAFNTALIAKRRHNAPPGQGTIMDCISIFGWPTVSNRSNFCAKRLAVEPIRCRMKNYLPA